MDPKTLDKSQTLSIDNASDSHDQEDSTNLNVNIYLVLACLVAALASFNAGYNSGVANIPEAIIRKCEEVSYDGPFPSCLPAGDLVWGVIIGLFALGGGFGGLMASRMLSGLGRRNTLIFNNFFFIAGGVLLGTATTLAQLGVGRFIIGVGSGVASVAVSTYIGEIATRKCRGALGAVLQFMLVVGILISSVVSIPFNYTPGWRILFALGVIPALLQAILLPFFVETPRYLVSIRQMEKAKDSLQRLRSGLSIEKEYNEIVDGQYKQATQSQSESPSSSLPLKDRNSESTSPLSELFKEKVLFKHLIICLVIHAAQQFSGINGVIFYSTAIFEKTFGSENAAYVTIGVGVLNLIVTMISVFLIDRLGRKFLMAFSFIGMCLSSILIVIGSVYKIDIMVVICVLSFTATFAIGLGPIPWLYISEMFPTRTLAPASALAIAVNWFCNFIIGLVFPSILSGLQDYTFLIFAIITFVFGLFTIFFVPETKGKSIEEVLSDSYKAES